MRKEIFCEGCHSCNMPCGKTTVDKKWSKKMSSALILLIVIIVAPSMLVASFYYFDTLLGVIIVLFCCGYIIETFAKPLFEKAIEEVHDNKQDK